MYIQFNTKDMKMNFIKSKLIFSLAFSCMFGSIAYSQTAEWRLVYGSYSSTDPDGGGPAMGSVTFTMQMHAVSTSFSASNISVGYQWQTSNFMLPTSVLCPASIPYQSNPPNVVVSSAFISGGFAYNNVFQCNVVAEGPTGGQSFDRRANGTLETGSSLTITTSWVDVMTVTLWTLNSNSVLGYVRLNSGEGGSPGEYTTYSVFTPVGDPIPVNSLTYTNPLALTSSPVPVTFTKSSVTCSPSGASIVWGTASESNTNYFEVLKSADGGNSWVAIDRKAAAGNSATDRNYQLLDLEAGVALYKIRQVDRDGRSTETAVMRSTCEAKNAITSILYPVPANNNMTLAITANKMVKTTLQIVDAKGRLMQTREVTITKGNNNIPFNVSRLAAGEYMLISSNPELTLNKKFIVAR